MPYVPPHLRKANSSGPSSSEESSNQPGILRSPRQTNSDYETFSKRDISNGSPRNYSRGGDFPSKDRPPGSQVSVRRPFDSRPSFNPDPVWKEWEPSERVKELTEDQVQCADMISWVNSGIQKSFVVYMTDL